MCVYGNVVELLTNSEMRNVHILFLFCQAEGVEEEYTINNYFCPEGKQYQLVFATFQCLDWKLSTFLQTSVLLNLFFFNPICGQLESLKAYSYHTGSATVHTPHLSSALIMVHFT